MSLTLTEIAFSYSALGWLIVPVIGKKPIGDEWQKSATNDQAKLAKLFHRSGFDGVGVQLGQRSGVIDFDADSDEAETTFQRLFAGHEFKTPTFQSAKGKHRLFRWCDKLPSPDKIRFIIDGLEVRTGSGEKGAQTVLPPANGRTWIIEPDRCELAPIPDEVIERIWERYNAAQARKVLKPQPGYAAAPRYGDSETLDVPRWLAKHGREIIGRTESGDVTRWHIECPGIERHSTSNSFRDCCITQDSAGKLGGCCFHSSCGMSDWPALRTAIGELEYADYHEPEDVSSVDLSSLMKAVPATQTEAQERRPTDSPGSIPPSLFNVPGLIGDMISHHMAHAPRPRPELSMAASIALMGTITGRKIRTATGMRTNIYCIGLAPSGSGKERPRQDNRMALTESGCSKILGAENPASDAGLISELEANPAVLIQIDEISHYIQSIRSSGSGSQHLRGIFNKILECYSQSENPLWMPKGYGDRTKSKSIEFPHLSIYGTSTADGFWSSVSTANATDGFLARMMVVETSSDFPRLQHVETAPTPQNVVDIIKAWDDFKPGKGHDLISSERLRATTVPIDSAAKDRLRDHSEGIEDRLADESPEQRSIWGRASAMAAKMSLIFAASRGPDGIQVGLDDADNAVKFVNHSTRHLVSRVFTHVSEDQHDERRKKALQRLRGSGGHATRREFLRFVQGITGKRSQDDFLAGLVAMGDVQVWQGKLPERVKDTENVSLI